MVRSRKKRALFVVVALILVWGAIELAALVAWRVLFGAGYSPSSAHAERAALASSTEDGAATPPVAAANRTNWCLHPYLGYVLDPEDDSVARDTGDPALGLTDWGFVDEGPPFRSGEAGDVVIGIVGGSVAASFAEQGTATLARALREVPGLDDKRIVFVRLAIPGYRQPQQLIAVELALAQGAHFDAVVDISGLNELAEPVLKGESNGIHPLYPSNWQFLAASAVDPATLRAIGGAGFGRALRGDVAGWFDRSWLSHSVVANLLWKGVDRVLQRSVDSFNTQAQSARPAIARYAVSGPRNSLEDVGQRLEFGADVWARCTEQMDDLCRARGIELFTFLQPNQYVPDSKPLSDDERAHAYDPQHPSRRLAELGFPKLRRRGDELAARGIAFHDLSRMFAQVSETLYVDPCCHLNREGNRLLALQVAQFMGPVLAAGREPLRSETIEALRIDPVPVELRLPLQTRALRVWGRLADDSERDITYACREFISSAPELVTVDEYGVLTALREGKARVRASFAGREIACDVDVAFPSQAVLDNRAPRTDDPKLRARVDADQIECWLDPGMPTGLSEGWLLVGTDPFRAPYCREFLFADATRSQMLRIEPTADGVRWRIAITAALRGHTVYLQCGIVDQNQPCRLRTTNALAVTLR